MISRSKVMITLILKSHFVVLNMAHTDVEKVPLISYSFEAGIHKPGRH